MAMRRSAPFPLITYVGDLGPVPDNIKSVNVIVITASEYARLDLPVDTGIR